MTCQSSGALITGKAFIQHTNHALTKSNPVAVFNTNLGTFTVELYENQMPITVGNFKKLAKSNFYNKTRFHRVIDGFMIQGGDPLSKDKSQQLRWGTGDRKSVV